MKTEKQPGSITLNIPNETWEEMTSRWSQLGFKSPSACEDYLYGLLINSAMSSCAQEIRKWMNMDLRFFGVCDQNFYADDDES